jgi:small-conductance mechanosensitive channel/CRP-like cAMP-binding protein
VNAGGPNPWVVTPLAIALLAVFARLTRVQPALRPLLGPLAAAILAATAFVALGYEALPAHGSWSLLVLVPALMLVVRSAGIALQAVFRRRQGYAAPALLESVVAVILYGVGTGVVAHRWFGVELTPFLATSAVVGAVVGLALQDTLGNLFAGIALHTAAPFRVGDWVKVSASEGQVEEASWRAVRLRTWYGDTVTIPNNEVASGSVQNYSEPREPHSRLLAIGVNYHTPPNKVLSVLQSLLAHVETVLKDPAPVLRVVAYGDFAIQYEMRYFVARYEDYRTAEGEINRLIWYYFRRNGIEIPFPVRNVYLHNPGEPEGRDSTSGRLQRALRDIDLFRPLSDDEVRSAAASFRHLHYSTGEKIIEEGAPGDSFFVIDRGEVDVFKTLGGKARTLARLMEGQCFGEMALLTGEKRSATVIAATDVDVFTLDKAGFEKILVPNPAIAVEISGLLSQRRDALSQAEDDTTERFYGAGGGGRKQHILDRIRSYFGL